MVEPDVPVIVVVNERTLVGWDSGKVGRVRDSVSRTVGARAGEIGLGLRPGANCDRMGRARLCG